MAGLTPFSERELHRRLSPVVNRRQGKGAALLHAQAGRWKLFLLTKTSDERGVRRHFLFFWSAALCRRFCFFIDPRRHPKEKRKRRQSAALQKRQSHIFLCTSSFGVRNFAVWRLFTTTHRQDGSTGSIRTVSWINSCSGAAGWSWPGRWPCASLSPPVCWRGSIATTVNDATATRDMSTSTFPGNGYSPRCLSTARADHLYDRRYQEPLLEQAYPQDRENPKQETPRRGDDSRVGDARSDETSLSGPMYPPIHGMLFAPLGLLSPQTAYRTMQAINLVLTFVAAWLIERLTKGGVVDAGRRSGAVSVSGTCGRLSSGPESHRHADDPAGSAG